MKKNNIITIILVLIIVILSGYIIYDKVLLNDKTDVVDKDNLDYDKNQDNNGDNNVEDKVDDNTENDVDNSQSDNVGNNKIGKIEVEVIDNYQNVEKTNGNYKDYTDKKEGCGGSGSNTCYYNYDFESNENYKSIIDVEDTYAIFSWPNVETRLFILKDGNLYYNIGNCINRNGDSCYYSKYDFYDESYHNNYNSLYLFNELTNIKRIKGYNHGSGVDYSLLLITNDGDVYSLSYYEKFTLYKVTELSQYYVDDVIEYESGFEFGSTYKIILKDGTVLTKSIKVED